MTDQQVQNLDTESDNPPGLTHVIVLAASTGGLGAISTLLADLPPSLPAAIAVVQHLSSDHPSHMAEILSRRTSLPVKQAEVGDSLQAGRVYIAPPNYHLLINADGSLTLSSTDKIHFVRPAADRLFESVAASFQERVIAVVLTGYGCDGAIGVEAVKKAGGIVIAQSQTSAANFGMPEAAIDTGIVDYILPLSAIAAQLLQLCSGELHE